jgi:hypothetical protein
MFSWVSCILCTCIYRPLRRANPSVFVYVYVCVSVCVCAGVRVFVCVCDLETSTRGGLLKIKIEKLH